MKKTFMAMLLLGGTMSMFAQNTQTGTTGNQTGTTGTTGTTTQGTQSGTTTQGTTTTNDPTMGTNTGTTTNSDMNNGNVNSTTGTTGTWNGVSNNPSTSWAPEKDPSWNWNNHGVWSGSANWNANSNGTSVYGSNNMNNGTMNNGTTNADGSMSSTGTYNAYSGTAIPSLPANVQMRFSQDFPTGANNQYTWHQYGDWFHTHYNNNGRLMQYFYDQRGSGYALALPVLHTYVPENIIASAISKYGTSLYSISMVKTADGNDAYQIGLLQRGQMNMQYLDESGVSVANVWRVDSLENAGDMNSMQSNAAMDNGTNMTTDQSGTNNQSGSTMNNQQSGMYNGNSSKPAKAKQKTNAATNSNTNNQHQ